jgi:hypothetical protein
MTGPMREPDTLVLNVRKLVIDGEDIVARVAALDAKLAALEGRGQPLGERSDVIAAIAALANKIAALEAKA